MSTTAVAGMVLEAWKDLDRATANLSSEDAERRVGTASPISWSAAHVTEQLDTFVNARFQGKARHTFLGRDVFRFGAAGDPADWSQVQQAVAEVRETARAYLEGLTDVDLDRHVAYDGSIRPLRETGLSVRYGLIRVALHHYFHIGEIAAVRKTLGHNVGDYPGLLEVLVGPGSSGP